MQARFDAKKKDILDRLAQPEGDYTDASPKGSVDESIRVLVKEINDTPGYVTTSSCSGRVAVYLEGPLREGGSASSVNGLAADVQNDAPSTVTSSSGKGGGRWLFTSHAKVDLKAMQSDGVIFSLFGIEPTTNLSYPGVEERQLVHLKFEPMILHILCNSPEQAQLALSAAAAAGFRESGISSLMDSKGQETPPMVAVRSSGLAFDMIIASLFEGRILPMVTEPYLRTMLNTANRRFHENELRKTRFRDAFLRQTSLSGSSSSVSRPANGISHVRKKVIPDRQRRKEERKEEARQSMQAAISQEADVHVCPPDDYDDISPEDHIQHLVDEEPHLSQYVGP